VKPPSESAMKDSVEFIVKWGCPWKSMSFNFNWEKEFTIATQYKRMAMSVFQDIC
jgi:hypothetical protein